MSRLAEWESIVCEPSEDFSYTKGAETLVVTGGGPSVLLFPSAAGWAEMQEAIDFVAMSWWRRTLIRWVSGGKVRFERN